MKQRSNRDGVTSETRSMVYFDENSQLIIRQLFPMELFVFNNKEGELKIYNPEKNQVFQQMNYMLGSQNNQFYFFLMNKTDDMGLFDLGFELMSSRLEDQLLISEYNSPPSVKQYFDKVELVHKGKRPIFVGYKDKKGKFLKKVYYYNYIEDIGLAFPGAITEINYIDKRDSIVSKTSFTNFKINDEVDREIMRFEIPLDAQLIE
ncbi:MAG: hypothetical protein ACJAZM_000208 [Cyclobacteriaceae bacterium]|jgi:hypothetical protein